MKKGFSYKADKDNEMQIIKIELGLWQEEGLELSKISRIEMIWGVGAKRSQQVWLGPVNKLMKEKITKTHSKTITAAWIRQTSSMIKIKAILMVLKREEEVLKVEVLLEIV